MRFTEMIKFYTRYKDYSFARFSYALLLLMLMTCDIQLSAQINSLSSMFNQPGFAFFSPDSNNYLNNNAKTVPILTEQINAACPFSSTSFFGDLSQITPDTTMVFLPGLHSQVPWHDTLYQECKFSFSYQNKNSNWYAYYKKSLQNSNNAIIILPGSGAFQSLRIAQGDVTNYHFLNGNVRTKCLQYGDLYVYNKINEEYRSFWHYFSATNVRRLSYDYLTPYTDLNGNHWAPNMYIELVAAIKTLKKKYDKVFILGLSSGGFPALITGIFGEADGINCAAGISSWSYNGFLLPTLDQPYFSGMLENYTFDSLHNLMINSESRFLFSYGALDDGGNAFEHDTGSIEDSLDSPCNTDYFYNFNYHTFPVVYYDTFFTKVIKTPKVTLQNYSNGDCTTDSMKLLLKFKGLAPYSFALYKNDTFYQQYSTPQDSIIITLNEQGTYHVQNLIDIHNAPLCKSKKIKYDKPQKLSYQIQKNGFLCEQQKDSISITLSGVGPFYCNYIENGISKIDTLQNGTKGFKTFGGSLIFNTITDSNTCLYNIKDTITTTLDTLSAALGPAFYDCNSLITKKTILLSGKAPYTLQYSKWPNLYTTQTIQSNNDTLDLNNGIYSFIQVNDSNGCHLPINEINIINNNPISVNIPPPTYNCDSNKSLITFSLTGNSPYTIFYRKNGAPTSFSTSSATYNLWVTNGNYTFDSIKDATCKKVINTTYSVNYSPISVTIGASSTNCDSNKTNIPIFVSGNPPYVLRYQKDGVAQSNNLNGNTNLLLSNGTYLFQELEDAQGCIKVINQVRVLNHQVLNSTMTTPTYNCDSNKSLITFSLTGNSPYTIFYRKNGAPTSFSTSSATYNLWVTNGNYTFDSIKDATCKKIIPTNNFAINTDPIDATISNPVYVCDSNKTKLSISCLGTPPFNLYYKINATPFVFTTGLSNFDLYFSNSNLIIEKVTDANGCEKFLNNNYSFNENPVSASLSAATYNCDSMLHFINVQTTGKAPWNILYSNGTSTSTFTTSLNSSILKLPNGNYNILSVLDANGCLKPINQSYTLNSNTTTISILNAGYDCDSNKLKVIVNLANHGPWILQFQKIAPNPQNFSLIASNPSNTFYFSPGSYVLNSLTNQLGCVTYVGYSFSNNFTPLSISKLSSNIDCDSAKLKTTYQLNGDGPWNLIYQDLSNGLFSSLNSSSPLLNIYNPTGSIKLAVLSDSKCTIPLSDTIVNNYVPMVSQFLNQSHACDSGKTKVSFLTTGGMLPYNYSFAFNGTNFTQIANADSVHLFLPKGSLFATNVSDALGCTFPLNTQLTLDYSPFRFDSLVSWYDCHTDSSFIKYYTQNSSPLTVNFTPKSGSAQQFTFLNQPQQYLPNNTYYIHSIVDTFGCAVAINDTLSINNYPVKEQKVSKIHNCTTQDYKFFYQLSGTAPWQLDYVQDNVAQQMLVSQSPLVLPASIGEYYFISVTDSNLCQDTIHQYHQLQPFLDTAFSINYLKAMLSVNIPAVKYFWHKDSQVFDTTLVPSTAFIGNGSYYVTLIDTLGCEYTSQILNIENIEPIIVYPNPSDGMYTITLNYKLTEPWTYTLFDMYGRKIKTETQTENHHRLDIRSFSKGKYVLHLHYNKDGFYTNKVIALEKR